MNETNYKNQQRKLQQERLTNPIFEGARNMGIFSGKQRQFANRLRQNQVPVTHITLPGSIHLFITVPHQDAAFHQSVQLTKTFLKDKYNIIPGSFPRP